MHLQFAFFDYIFIQASHRVRGTQIANLQAEFSQHIGGRMHHISGETSISHINESTAISQTHIQDANAGSMMRVLSVEEVLSVAGGPEVDVESGGGG